MVSAEVAGNYSGLYDNELSQQGKEKGRKKK